MRCSISERGCTFLCQCPKQYPQIMEAIFWNASRFHQKNWHICPGCTTGSRMVNVCVRGCSVSTHPALLIDFDWFDSWFTGTQSKPLVLDAWVSPPYPTQTLTRPTSQYLVVQRGTEGIKGMGRHGGWESEDARVEMQAEAIERE